MVDCCSTLGRQFDERVVEREYRRHVRKGPDRTTRWLIEMVAERGVNGATLLDIGGGLGAVQAGLLEAGAASAVSVDAAPAYGRAAARLAEERGYGERVERRLADFAAMADTVPAADVVTLDRVICCYPDIDRLVARSAARAQRVYGIVVPRDHLPNRVVVRLENWLRRLMRNEFRGYVHRTARIDALVRDAGLAPVARRRTLGWEVTVFARP